MMQNFFLTTCILIIVLASPSHAQSSILINEDRPSLIDNLLQMVWEPSSLIRWWTGLDQLYNIALSWRTAAKTVVTLPFREGRSMDHVTIQKPRRAKGMIKLQSRYENRNHHDRFNKIYSAAPSNPVPQVAVPQPQIFPPPLPFSLHPPQQPNLQDLSQFLLYNERFPPVLNSIPKFQNIPLNHIELLNNNFFNADIASKMLHSKPDFQNLPPNYLSLINNKLASGEANSEFPNSNIVFHNVPHNFMRVDAGSNVVNSNPAFHNVPPKYHEQLKKQSINDNIKSNAVNSKPASSMSAAMLFPFSGTTVPNSNPEARLNMLLKLLKNLGEEHTNKVIFDEDVKEGIR